jgi:hypothetical protein
VRVAGDDGGGDQVCATKHGENVSKVVVVATVARWEGCLAWSPWRPFQCGRRRDGPRRAAPGQEH